MNLARITFDHQIMGGVPCVTGTRIPVTTVVGLMANGLTTDEITRSGRVAAGLRQCRITHDGMFGAAKWAYRP
jgi:Protein of unknown function (DUF433)